MTKKELLKRIEILEVSDKICEPRLVELDKQVKKLTEINRVLFDHLKIGLFVEEFINKKHCGESFVDKKFIIKNTSEVDNVFFEIFKDKQINDGIYKWLKETENFFTDGSMINKSKKSNGRKTSHNSTK